jgi:hypothetical protein
MTVKQLHWSPFRHGVSYSHTPFDKRFAIVERTSGYTVTDCLDGSITRTVTLAAAHAWAGIRVVELAVRRGNRPERAL